MTLTEMLMRTPVLLLLLLLNLQLSLFLLAGELNSVVTIFLDVWE